MPFVRIDLVRGKSVQYRQALGDIVYKAMVDVINVPENDKFKQRRPIQLFPDAEASIKSPLLPAVLEPDLTLR